MIRQILTFSFILLGMNAYSQSANYRMVVHNGKDSLCLNMQQIDSITFDNGITYSDLGNVNWSEHYPGKGHYEDLTYSESSTYIHDSDKTYYNDIFIDGHNVYAVGWFGLRKIDYSNENEPCLVYENNIHSNDRNLECRAIAKSNNNLYIAHRVSWSNYVKDFAPISQHFEEMVACMERKGICSNSTVNSFFRKLHISRDLSNVANVCLFKAYHRPNGKYGNSIVFTFNGGEPDLFMLGDNYDTREEALAALSTEYSKENGDYCLVDWHAVPEGNNVYYNVVFYDNIYAEYIHTAGAYMSIVNKPCPSRGQHCAEYVTSSLSNDSVLINYGLNIYSKSAEVSFWLCIEDTFNGEVTIPLFQNANNLVYGLSLTPSINGYSLSSDNGAISKNFSMGVWYNIKASYKDGEKKLYYRSKECLDWNLIGSYQEGLGQYIDQMSIGIISPKTGARVLIDNLFYSDSDVDAVSYNKGKLDIIDKKTLTVKNTLNLEFPITDLGIKDDILVVSCLDAINIYDIQDADNPELVFNYRPSVFRDIQGLSFFEHNSRKYVLVCKYTYGVMIIDITEKDNISIVNDDEFNELKLDGIDHAVTIFSAIVDYPYAYLTYSPHPYYAPNHRTTCGVISLNLSNLEKLSYTTYPIATTDITSNVSGDPAPTTISKYANTLYVNNRERGVAVYDIFDNGVLEYKGLIDCGSGTSVNRVKTDKSGRMFLTYDGTSACGLKVLKIK